MFKARRLLFITPSHFFDAWHTTESNFACTRASCLLRKYWSDKSYRFYFIIFFIIFLSLSLSSFLLLRFQAIFEILIEFSSTPIRSSRGRRVGSVKEKKKEKRKERVFWGEDNWEKKLLSVVPWKNKTKLRLLKEQLMKMKILKNENFFLDQIQFRILFFSCSRSAKYRVVSNEQYRLRWPWTLPSI